MPALTIQGVPNKLFRQLQRRAVLHRRCLNSEVIACLEQVATASLIDPTVWLAEVDRLRGRFPLGRMTDAEIRRAKSNGRP